MGLGNIQPNDLIFFIIILIIALGSLIITRRLLKVPFPYFFMGILGIIIGLMVGGLLGKFLTSLPGIYGKWLPIMVQVFVTVAVFDLFIAQAMPAAKFFANLLHRDLDAGLIKRAMPIIVDTSALIDGRIEDVVQTGFISGELIVPKFVLNELQSVADSKDFIRREKGRRGLEVLNNLQDSRQVKISILEENLDEKETVDNKLMELAKAKKGQIITLDFNLGRVAQIRGVSVLSINELAVALKPKLIPGEKLIIKVIQKGKEKRQGVGYLVDGTMVVIEGGDKYVGEEIECEVIRIYQTVAGKMVFVQPIEK